MPQFLHKEGHVTANCKGPIDHYRKFLLLMILCICWIFENYIFCTCNMTFCPDNSSFEYQKLAVTVYVMMLGLMQLSCSQIITNNRMFCLLFYYILTLLWGQYLHYLLKLQIVPSDVQIARGRSRSCRHEAAPLPETK